MDNKTFNAQYKKAAQMGDFARTLNLFVVDDDTALAALQVLHERINQLAKPDSCQQWLWFLSNDLADLIEETTSHWKSSAPPWEGVEMRE